MLPMTARYSPICVSYWIDSFRLNFIFIDLRFFGDTVDLKKSLTVLDANGKYEVDVVVMTVISPSLSSISSSNNSRFYANIIFFYGWKLSRFKLLT